MSQYSRRLLLLVPVVVAGFLGCNTSPRYVVISENVAAAGAASASADFAPETETIRGRVIRLDTRSGEMVVVTGEWLKDDAGDFGFMSSRVFSPDEAKAILSRLQSKPTAGP